MSISNRNNTRIIKGINLLAILTLVLAALAVSTTAQSTDPFSPTAMTTEVVKGRWPSGKRVAYYYSFTAGPGVVKVQFNCKSDGSVDACGGQLSDADGHLLTPVENRGDSFLTTAVGGMFYEDGGLFVATYEIKRRQKFIFKFYTDLSEKEYGGNYSIKVSGDGVLSKESITSTNNGSTNNNNGADNASCLPKSGKLRLVMEDGTIQEINLSRVREAAIKP
jgi:hypothetical protein